MLLQRYSPDSGLRSDLGRLMSNAFLTPWTFDPWATSETGRTLPATIEEKEGAVFVRVELPGVDPEQIGIDLVGEDLTISVETEEENGNGEGAPHRFRAFRQTLRLPCAVDPNEVSASSRHGVLTVELKKPVESMPKRIRVVAS